MRNALPSLFLSHGSPMIALEPGAAGAFMQRLGPAIDRGFGRPKAILAISAHTSARAPVLLAAPRHETIHDFGGFDPKLFTLRYDAPGAPELASRVVSLMSSAGLDVEPTNQGGLDHGIWTVLRYVYPEADKLGKQFKYASSRHVPFVAIVGDDERQNATVSVKDLRSGAQETVPRAQAASFISTRLLS